LAVSAIEIIVTSCLATVASSTINASLIVIIALAVVALVLQKSSPISTVATKTTIFALVIVVVNSWLRPGHSKSLKLSPIARH
jgi:hypothetical protein